MNLGLGKRRGFTLVELMITVAIVAVLASIAVPSYSNYIRKGKRQAGTTCLMDARDRMEKFYQRENAYPPALGTVYGGGSDTPNCPESEYVLSLDASGGSCTTPKCFTLRATPRAGTSQVKDGSLVLISRFDNDPNLRIVKKRLVGDVEKTWDDY